MMLVKERHKITIFVWLNIFSVVKVNFSVICDAVFIVNVPWTEMTKFCI